MITEQKLFNLSYLEQLADNDFIAEVIVLYLKDTNTDLQEMKMSFDTGAFDTVCNMAHKLKSSTGMLQANSLFSILEQIEKTAKEGLEIEELAQLVQAAGYEFDQLKPALEWHLKLVQTVA